MSPPLRPEVVVDVFAGLQPAGGIGRYVRDLCAALQRPDAPPARFAYPGDWAEVAEARFAPARRLPLPPWWQLRARYTLATWLGGRFDRQFGWPAVFHSPVGYGPTFARTRLIAHLHDLTIFEHPEWHPFKANQFLRVTVPYALRHAAVVLTHSRHVASRAVASLGVAPERIATIPPPLGHGFHPVERARAERHVRDRFALEGPFLLHVGTFEPRKNHIRMIGAFETLCRAGFPGRLVLVGGDGWHMAPILARIEASSVRARIVRLQGLADDDLVALYGACTMTLYPSLEEGFGMPLLESMACGVACIASDVPALRELGGDVARQVPADDEPALAAAMIALWRDEAERERLARAGPARAAPYAFERWTARIFELYRRELAAAR
ncbi:MAG TPA: glycosyltransferase family 1 protein [Candidatus Eisenbacteria bacterium]|nr:glycosyltransferase family 1 protein [Candidatus Eisenbacteria bacterium]